MVIVHDFELTAKADNATGTSGCQLLAQFINKHVGGGSSLTARGVASDRMTEKVRGKFTVGNGTGRVFIIDIEEGIEVLTNKKYSNVVNLPGGWES